MSIDILSYNKAMQALRKAGFVGTKDVDETGLVDENILYYSEELDKYITQELKVKVKEWNTNTQYEKNEIVVYDDILHWTLESHFSHQSSIDFDLIDEKITPLVAESGLANILGLEYNVNPSKTQTELTWTNPSAESFEGRDIFIGVNKDISNLTYQECEDLATGVTPLSEQVISVDKVESGMGTGLGEADSYTFDMQERNKYYVKIFARHGTEDGVKAATGRYVLVENPDITPPAPISDLDGVVEDGKITLSWTQPTDSDFLYTKLVRSITGEPETPSDGQVLETIREDGSFVDTNIDKGIEYFYKLFSYDDSGDGFEYGIEGNWSASNGLALTDVAMYGFDVALGERTRDAINLSQEDFDNRYPWSDVVRAVVDVSGEVVYYLDDNNSNLQESGAQANLTGADGNVVVEYPGFFYSYADGEMLLANEEFEGARKFERTIVGAFEATESTMGEIQSVVGQRPLTSKSITEYRLMSSDIGVGWHQKDIEFLEVLKILFAIEYGGLNSQDLIGNGLVNEDEQVLSGSTVSLGNKTGVSADGAVSYRGLENPWGNTWEFVEGLYATDEAYYTATGGYDTFLGEDSTGSYISTGIIPITDDGFMSSMHDKLMVANEVLGNTVSFTGDYQYSHKEGEINLAVHGGDYKDGDKAGLFRTHMGLKPFGKEEEMDLVEGSIYEKSIIESDLEELKNIIVS